MRSLRINILNKYIMEKPQIIISTIKRGDEITYPKKGNHLRIHFEVFVQNKWF